MGAGFDRSRVGVNTVDNERLITNCYIIPLVFSGELRVALALGTIEIYGIPTAMEVADTMCKSARVTLVGFENTDAGRLTVLIRGAVGEVETAVRSGLAAISKVNGGKLLSHHIIPNPHRNVEVVMAIGLSEDIESVREIRFPPPVSP